MIISNTYRVAFLALPKNASRSVGRWLRKDYQAKYYGGHHEVISNKKFIDYLPFVVVRSPLSREVSNWFYSYLLNGNHYKPTKRFFKNTLLPKFVWHINEMPKAINSFNIDYPKSVTERSGSFNLRASAPYQRYVLPQTVVIDFAQKQFNKPIHVTHIDNLVNNLSTLPFVDKKVELPQVTIPMNLSDPDAYVLPVSWQEFYRNKHLIDIVYNTYKSDFTSFGFKKSL